MVKRLKFILQNSEEHPFAWLWVKQKIKTKRDLYSKVSDIGMFKQEQKVL